VTIEIKQLVVRAVVETRRERPSVETAPRARAAPERARSATRPPHEKVDREELITACVREVLRELKKGRER